MNYCHICRVEHETSREVLQCRFDAWNDPVGKVKALYGNPDPEPPDAEAPSSV